MSKLPKKPIKPKKKQSASSEDILWQYIKHLKSSGYKNNHETKSDYEDVSSLLALAQLVKETFRVRDESPSEIEESHAKLMELIVEDQVHRKKTDKIKKKKLYRLSFWKFPKRYQRRFQFGLATVVIFLVLGIKFLLYPYLTSDVLKTEWFLQDHQKYLAASQPAEMFTSAHRDLSLWLSDELGFEVNGIDLSSLNIQLIGGRRCLYDETPAAMMVYQKDLTRITLYQISELSCKLPELTTVIDKDIKFLMFHAEVFNLIIWEKNQDLYAIVSVLDLPALLNIAKIVCVKIDYPNL